MNGQSATAGTVVNCTLVWANYTRTYTTVTAGPQTVTVTSTSQLTQLSFNASTAQNQTAFIDLKTGADAATSVFLPIYIPDPNQPSYYYTFPVTDFVGMTNAFLRVSINNGSDIYLAQQINLNSTGTPTFLLTQFQTYVLTFIADQGTYSQQFTAQTTLATTLSVMSGAFPSTSTNQSIAEATRLNATHIEITYLDADSATTNLTVTVTHNEGANTITDYTETPVTPNSYNTILTVDNETDYYVNIQATRSGVLNEWTIPCFTLSTTNPFNGLFDWLGTFPTGVDPAQLIAGLFIMLCLGLGSFRSAGVSCILAIIMTGIFLAFGWYSMGVPMFVFTFFLGFLVVLSEGKDQARDA